MRASLPLCFPLRRRKLLLLWPHRVCDRGVTTRLDSRFGALTASKGGQIAVVVKCVNAYIPSTRSSGGNVCIVYADTSMFWLHEEQQQWFAEERGATVKEGNHE